MATPARQKALQEIIAMSVGAPPAMSSRYEDRTLEVPDMPQQSAMGVVRRQEEAPGMDEEALLRQRAAIDNLAADSQQSSARFIETVTGAPSSGVHEEMRKRANEPLESFLRLQEKQSRGKPAAVKAQKSTDPNSPASRRAQLLIKATLADKFTDEEIAQLTEADAEYALKYGSLSGQREVTREGHVDANTRSNLDRAQRGELFVKRYNLDWAKLSQDQQQFLLTLAEKEKDRGVDAAKTAAKDVTELRKELQGNQITKDFLNASVAFDKVRRAASDPSPAGDLALIFGVMKTFDPGSTVREGEFANAENAKGVPESIRARWNKFLSGERLTPSQRKDFVRVAESQFGAQRDAYDALAKQYEGLAPEGAAQRVVLPDIAPAAGASPKRAPPASSVLPTDASGNLTLDSGTSDIPETIPPKGAKPGWLRQHLKESLPEGKRTRVRMGPGKPDRIFEKRNGQIELLEG